VEYGTKRVQQNTRKRGINMLINIMSRFGRNLETESKVLGISASDPNRIRSVDPYPDPDLESGSGSRRAKMTQKIKKFHVLMFFFEGRRLLL
jgi:hypothetical protein